MIYFPEKSKEENDAFACFLDEVNDHMVYVLREKFGWQDINQPEMSIGGGHVVIRFEKNGQRMVFRVPRYGREQLKRSMLAYRYIGDSGLMPEKIYHDGKCIIEQHADGQQLNPEVSDQVVISLAQKLSHMHAVETENFGPLDFDLQGTHADAETYYLKRPKITVDRSDTDLTSTESAFLNTANEKAGQIHTDLLTAKTHLGHGDLWRNNIIVNQDDFKIIDWDRIGSYPIEYDLGFMIDADFTDVQKNLFFLNYSHKVNFNLLKWFALRRTMLNGKLLLKNKIAKIRRHALA